MAISIATFKEKDSVWETYGTEGPCKNGSTEKHRVPNQKLGPFVIRTDQICTTFPFVRMHRPSMFRLLARDKSRLEKAHQSTTGHKASKALGETLAYGTKAYGIARQTLFLIPLGMDFNH